MSTTIQTPKEVITEVFEECGAQVKSVNESLYGGKPIYIAELKTTVRLSVGSIQLGRLAVKGLHVFSFQVVPYGNHQVFEIEFMSFLSA